MVELLNELMNRLINRYINNQINKRRFEIILKNIDISLKISLCEFKRRIENHGNIDCGCLIHR